MIRVTSLAVSMGRTSESVAYHYEIAKTRIVFQTAVKSLKAYEIGPASASFNDLLNTNKNRDFLNASNSELRYQGLMPFRSHVVEIRYWQHNELSQIDVNTVPICQIDFANAHIHVLNDQSFDDDLNLEVVIGPALIMLLSKQGLYCLHAGAVATPQGNFAMLAESGTGKSTLSTHIDADWLQLADDILPLKLGDGAELIHQFPQLKLNNARVSKRLDQTVFLDCILRLDQEPSAQIEFKCLKRTDALLQVVRHTVAAKLFDQAMMREHARFAKHLTKRVPVYALSYPRDLNKLDELRGDISDFISNLKQS